MIKKTILSFFTFAMLLCVNVYAQTKYDDRIVFSKFPISETPDDSKLTDKFEFGETVYARFFLSKPLFEYKGSNGKYESPNYHIILSIDDKEYNIANNPKMFTEKNRNSKTYDFKFTYSPTEKQGLDVLLSPRNDESTFDW